MSPNEDDSREYVVVVNGEGQYSIWLAEGSPPAGWTIEGMRGKKSDCLQHISVVWTDMRPRSLRGEQPPVKPTGGDG